MTEKKAIIIDDSDLDEAIMDAFKGGAQMVHGSRNSEGVMVITSVNVNADKMPPGFSEPVVHDDKRGWSGQLDDLARDRYGTERRPAASTHRINHKMWFAIGLALGILLFAVRWFVT